MRLRYITWLVPICCCAQLSVAEEPKNALALGGFTGAINTPSAGVTQAGTIEFQYNSLLESQYVKRYPKGSNVIFSVGLLPYVELGGRLAIRNDPSRDRGDLIGGNRDLSGNIKIQIPFEHRYLPTFAVGAQDFAGGATHFRSRYAVASKNFYNFNVSLGYGTGPDRMKGPFGSIEWQALDWLSLLVDNDSDETNTGFRLTTPRPLFGFMDVILTAKLATTGIADERDVGFGIRIPLGAKHEKAASNVLAPDASTTSPAPLLTNTHSPSVAPQAPPSAIERSPHKLSDALPELTDNESHLLKIKRRLNELGFQHLSVGEDDAGGLYIRYENVRYNHSFLDGLGLVLGTAAKMAPDEVMRIYAIGTKRQIPLVTVAVDAALFRQFLTQPLDKRGEIEQDIEITAGSKEEGRNIYWYSGATNTLPTLLDILLYPDMRTFVGTEFGALDYSLALRANTRLNLWPGGLFSAIFDIPVSNSDDTEPRKIFAGAKHESGEQDMFLQQMFPIMDTMMNLTSIGRQVSDRTKYDGIWNETSWTPRMGAHNLRIKIGYFENPLGQVKEIYTGYYDYLFAPLDIVLEAGYGKYWYGDTGMVLTARRFFGDTAVSLFFKNNQDRAGGISVSFPLTPRRDPKPYLAQIRGSNRWSYGLQTSIGLAENSNPIDTRITVDSNTYFNLTKDVYDSGRLSAPYIKQHVLRLHDAFQTWGEEVK